MADRYSEFSVDDILREIRKQRKVIEVASARIDLLTDKLENRSFDDFDWKPIKTAADLLGVSVSYIYKKINDGTLDRRNVGSKIYVNATQVKELCEAMSDAEAV